MTARKRDPIGSALGSLIAGELVALEVGEGHSHIVGVFLGHTHIYGAGGRLVTIDAGTRGLVTVRRAHVTRVHALERDDVAALRNAERAARGPLLDRVDRARTLALAIPSVRAGGLA